MILGFDTSGPWCGVALLRGDTLVAARHEEMRKGQAERLFPMIEEVLGAGGADLAARESAMLWLLNQSDGKNSLLDIARRSGVTFEALVSTARELEAAELLRERDQEEQVSS